MLRLVQVRNSSEAQDDGKAVVIAREFQSPRLELLRLLHDAAEIEHSLMLQYVYGACSVKAEYANIVGVPDPTRSDCLMGVATQEMHHLRDVNGILEAFGGQPNLGRQSFPFDPQVYPFEMCLERLTRSSVAKYVYAEAPENALNEDAQINNDDHRFVRAVLAELHSAARMNHIGTLYQTVLSLLEELPLGERPKDIDEISQTIQQIVTDGEVTHFSFFKNLFNASLGSLRGGEDIWKDPESDRYPSLPVPTNPSALLGHENQIKDPRLLQLAQLGNLHYWIVLSLMGMAFQFPSESYFTDIAVSHMTGGLLPISQLLAREGSGMPFDPLSMGYLQSGLQEHFVLALLQDAELKATLLSKADAQIATQSLDAITTTISILSQNEFEPTLQKAKQENAVVVGAGPAGLAAACTLASRGIPTWLLERADVVAGKVESHSVEGRSTEHGVHGWWMNYINFNRLMKQAGIDLDEALKTASGSNIAMRDGTVYPLRNFAINVPSPLYLALQILRAPYISFHDALRITRFGIHLLAFSHESDYFRYDKISFQELMDDMGVPKSVQEYFLTPFILSFDFATPDRVSAACGLSGCQFYILHDQKSVLARWSRGLPADTVFGPLARYFQDIGGKLLLGSPVRSVSIRDGRVTGVVYAGSTRSAPGHVKTIAALQVNQVGPIDFTRVQTSAGPCLITEDGPTYRAYSARCSHQGCNVRWSRKAQEFQCPCHGGRYDRFGQVLSGPPERPLGAVQTRVVGSTVELIGRASTSRVTCNDVVIATDTHAAQDLLAASPGVPTELTRNVAQLDTTPVIVVRLWLESSASIPKDLESAITPDATFVDNFFYLNEVCEKYRSEGQVVEVQSYRVDQWIDRSDSEILEAVRNDISGWLHSLILTKVIHFDIQRHLAIFSKFAPNDGAMRPGVDSGVVGLHLAGDWTKSDWSVWMMERGVVSGIRAANSVLFRRGLPTVEIERLPAEGLLLSLFRISCRVLRYVFWKNYP